MRVAVVGPGAIGSTFALHFASAGHDVTVIARTTRLAQLRRDGAIVTTDGRRAPINTAPTLDPATPFDLVLVTVLASQVDEVLPQLTASRAPVMFMFNTFADLRRLREAVGKDRFAWGFPAILARLVDGRLEAKVVPRLARAFQITTVGALPDFTPPWLETWRAEFERAGVPCVTHPDMQRWLRSHAAFMTALMATGVRAKAAGRGLRWSDARVVAKGMRAAFSVVRREGAVTPGGVRVLSWFPVGVISLALWVISRTRVIEALAANGPREAQWLIDEMISVAPDSEEAAELAELKRLGG